MTATPQQPKRVDLQLVSSPELAISSALAAELEESGLPRDVHHRLDYQSVSPERAHELTGYKHAGWVIAFRDPDGKPYTCKDGKPFCRLKPESGQLRPGPDGKAPKYLSPRGEGCRPYLSPLLPRDSVQGSAPLFITEGEKCADSANHHGFPTIGFCGVQAWKDKRSGDSAPLPELDQINWKREVFVVYDSDCTQKDGVRNAIKDLSLELASRGAQPRVVELPTEEDGIKNGIDDFLHRYGADAFKQLVDQAKPAIQLTAKGPRFIWNQPAPELSKRPTRAELQAFIASQYRVEFNQLTRCVELNGEPMADLHLADSFLAAQHSLDVPKQQAQDSFEYVAKSNPFNPVERYLNGLRSRTGLRLIPMEELAAAFAIEPHDHLSLHMLAAQLGGAVKRGLQPGAPHHSMLIFTGEQGTGKTSALKALFGSSFYDSKTKAEDLEDRDSLSKFNGSWGFEFDEVEHTLLKRTASELKGFLTRETDRYVEKYEKTTRDHPRTAVFFGTTNQSQFLNDHTGSRRIWVIDVEDRPLNFSWIRANRDSIWATVMTWLEWGLPTFFDLHSDFQRQIAARSDECQLDDPWLQSVATALNRVEVHGVANPGIAQDELMARLPAHASERSRDVQMRLTRIVTASSFITHGGSMKWKQVKRRWNGGNPRSGYIAVPTSRGRSNLSPQVGTEVGTSPTPWQNSSLQALFQPFQPISKELIERPSGDVHIRVCTDSVLSPPVGTVGTEAETPCHAVDLPVPTGVPEPSQTSEHPLPSEQPTPPATDPPWGSVARRLAKQHPNYLPVQLANLLQAETGCTVPPQAIKKFLYG